MRQLRNRSGFTILELLVSVGCAAIFGAAGVGFYRAQTRSLSVQSATIDATEKMRSAMMFLTREIRDAGYDPLVAALPTAGTKGVVFAGPTAIWVEFDRNKDGAIQCDATDPDSEAILFSYDATNQQILRTVNGVSQVLVKNIPSGTFAFQYFDAAGNALAMDTSPSVSTPAGCAAPPSAVQSAMSSGGNTLSPASRDLVALVQVSLQVQTVTNPSFNLALSNRVTLPARILDRL